MEETASRNMKLRIGILDEGITTFSTATLLCLSNTSMKEKEKEGSMKEEGSDDRSEPDKV